MALTAPGREVCRAPPVDWAGRGWEERELAAVVTLPGRAAFAQSVVAQPVQVAVLWTAAGGWRGGGGRWSGGTAGPGEGEGSAGDQAHQQQDPSPGGLQVLFVAQQALATQALLCRERAEKPTASLRVGGRRGERDECQAQVLKLKLQWKQHLPRLHRLLYEMAVWPWYWSGAQPRRQPAQWLAAVRPSVRWSC